MFTGRLKVKTKPKFNNKWYSKVIPYFVIWFNTLKQQHKPLALLFIITLISFYLPNKNIFWMVLGTVLCCFTTELIIEPNKCYSLELQNKKNTENIFCTVHILFYYLVHMTNVITGFEDNHYTQTYYYSFQKGYNDKISNLQELITIVKEKSTCDAVSIIKTNNQSDIEEISKKLNHLITMLNGIPNSLQIVDIKFLVFELQEYFEDTFVKVKNQHCNLDVFFLLEKYAKILQILNAKFYIHQDFLPSRHMYHSISFNTIEES